MWPARNAATHVGGGCYTNGCGVYEAEYTMLTPGNQSHLHIMDPFHKQESGNRIMAVKPLRTAA
jgi:hypothetical protein